MRRSQQRPAEKDDEQTVLRPDAIHQRAGRYLTEHHPEVERHGRVSVLRVAPGKRLAQERREHREDLAIEKIDRDRRRQQADDRPAGLRRQGGIGCRDHRAPCHVLRATVQRCYVLKRAACDVQRAQTCDVPRAHVRATCNVRRAANRATCNVRQHATCDRTCSRARVARRTARRTSHVLARSTVGRCTQHVSSHSALHCRVRADSWSAWSTRWTS